MEPGFSCGQSNNLPKVDLLMVAVDSQTMQSIIVQQSKGKNSQGPLHSHLLSQPALAYIYFSCGRTAPTYVPRAPLGAILLAIILGAIAPLLSFLVPALGHPDLAKGVLVSVAGAPCAWLGAALRGRAPLALQVAGCCVSMVTTPFVVAVVTGTLTIPPIGATITTFLATITPYTIGYLSTYGNQKRGKVDKVMVVVCGCWLVYGDTCGLLRRAEGSLLVGDVLGAIGIVVIHLSLSCALSVLACRRVCADQTLAVLTVTVCRDVDHMSPWSRHCSGLCGVSRALLFAAQATLVAALSRWHDSHGLDSDRLDSGEGVGEETCVGK